MKRFGLGILAFVVCLSLSALAQYGGTSSTSAQQSSSSTTSQTATSGKKAKAEHLKGTISQDDKTFTEDKTNRTWTIANPDEVKGKEGENVRLTAHVDPSDNSLHVVKVHGAKRSKSSKTKGGAMSEQPPQ